MMCAHVNSPRRIFSKQYAIPIISFRCVTPIERLNKWKICIKHSKIDKIINNANVKSVHISNTICKF